MILTYEVQQYTLCNGWVNTWSIIGEDDSQTPEVFNTKEEAQNHLDLFFIEIAEQIRDGEMQLDNGYDLEEFRVREV